MNKLGKNLSLKIARFLQSLKNGLKNTSKYKQEKKYVDFLWFFYGSSCSNFYQIKFWVRFILYLLAKYSTFKLAMTTGFLSVANSYCIAFSTNLTFGWNGKILVKFSFHPLVNYITYLNSQLRQSVCYGYKTGWQRIKNPVISNLNVVYFTNN